MAKNPVIRAGPFASVVDPADVGAAKPTRLYDAVNMVIADPILGSPAVQRHGFLALPQQLGSADVRRGQGMHLHRRLDGTVDRLTFGGGRVYLWNGVTTYTDITPVGISIDTDNPVFAKTFNDLVVISDETNKPWVYDPKTGTGTVIEYNSIHEEWNTKGGPVLYSGRIFFIVKTVGSSMLLTETGSDTLTSELLDALITEALTGFQNRIAWCAPLDVFSGYDQDAFDNTWELTQSSAEPLTALFADENALTYLRHKGIGYITGKVEDDFRAAATTDAIDTTIGTDAPAATVTVNRKLWFVDLDGRVHRAGAGAKPEELWRPMRRAIDRQVGTAQCRSNVARYARAAYHPSLKVVLFTIWDQTTLYVFDAVSGAYLGIWRISFGILITAMGELVDASDRAVFLAIGTADDRPTTTGASIELDHGTVWRQKFPDDVAPWRDSPPPATVSATPVWFERAIETHWLEHAGSLTFRVLTAVATVIGSTIARFFGLAYTVPASGRSTTLVAPSSTVRGGTADERALASVNWGLGRNAQGGAIRVRLSCEDVGPDATGDVQFGVHQIEVEIQTTKARRNAL